MKLIFSFVATALACMPAAAFAASSVHASGRLANGLTYHIFKVPSAGKRLVTRLNVGVGAADENSGEEGLAHITEHMVFQTSPEYPEGLAKHLQRQGWQMGFHFNAKTTHDYTRYMLNPPKGTAQLEQALSVYRRILQPADFSAEDWEKERPLVLNEWRAQQNLAARLDRRRQELMYRGARQGRYAPIGRADAIKRADMAAASAFHRRWYAGNNAVLAVAGNIDIGQTAALIQKTLGGLKTSDLPLRNQEEYEPVLQQGWHVGRINDGDNAESRLALVFRFKRTLGAAYAEDAYQRLLDNFAAYAVNRRIQESGGDVTLKMNTLGRRTGVLVWDAEVAPQRHGEMLELMHNLRQDILGKPVRDEELAGYRKALHARLSPQNAPIPDDLAQVAALADETVLQGLPAPDENRRMVERGQLYRINAAAVNRRIGEWLNAPDKMVQVQAPQAENVRLPQLAEMQSDRPPNTSTPISDGLRVPAFAPAQGGKILAERRDAVYDVHYLTLENGDTAVVMKLPMAGKKLYFKAVSERGSLSRGKQAWQAQLAADIVARSVPEGMNTGGFNRWLQEEGIQQYRFQTDGYSQTTDAQAANSALKPLLQLYRSRRIEPDFSGWQQAVKLEESRFNIGRTAKSARQRDLTAQLRYGENLLMPSESGAYAALKAQDLQRHWQALASVPATYYLVSNLPVDEVKSAVAQYLADIPRQPAEPAAYPLRSGRHVREAAVSDTGGAEIQAASWQQVGRLTPEQYEQINLLNNLANARLKEALRNGQSAYSVKFRARPADGGRRVESILTFSTDTADVKQAWQTVETVLRGLPESIGYREAANLRKLFVAQENARRRRPQLWLERLVESHRNYGDLRYFSGMPNMPASFSRSGLRNTAKLMWSPDNEQILVMLPRK